MTITTLAGTAIQTVARSDPGRSGKNNEDNYAVFEADSPGGVASRRLVCAIVADGIGGHNAGEKASRMAVDMFRMVMTRDQQTPVRERLERALVDANSEVYNASLDRPELEGMGTTVVAAVISGDALLVAHAGDSRAYLFRDGTMHRLTVDHTWAQEAIETGYLTPERARTHPNRNVIKRYLGIEERVVVDPGIIDIRQPADPDNPYAPRPAVDSLLLQPGDTLLLCSDGLTDELQDDEIAATLGRLSLERAAVRLVDQANAKGGRDNITVVLLRTGKTDAAGSSAAPFARAGRPSRNALLAIAGLLVLLAVLGGAAWAFSRRPAAPTIAAGSTVPPTTVVVAAASVTPPPATAHTPTRPETQNAEPGATTKLAPTSTPIPTPGEAPSKGETSPEQQPSITATAPRPSPVAPKVQLLSPAENALLSVEAEFDFVANRLPAANQGLELVFWRPHENPLDGFGPAGYTRDLSNIIKVDLDALDRDPNVGTRFEPGDYLWGVRLIQVSPFRPMELVSDARSFRFERQSPNQEKIPEPTPEHIP